MCSSVSRKVFILLYYNLDFCVCLAETDRRLKPNGILQKQSCSRQTSSFYLYSRVKYKIDPRVEKVSDFHSQDVFEQMSRVETGSIVPLKPSKNMQIAWFT